MTGTEETIMGKISNKPFIQSELQILINKVYLPSVYKVNVIWRGQYM